MKNYQGILLVAKVIPHYCCYAVDYGEFLNILQGYIKSFSLSIKIIVESYLLFSISNLGRTAYNLLAP